MTDLISQQHLSEAIDAYIESIPNRPPLQRDEKLYAAFAEDRDEPTTEGGTA